MASIPNIGRGVSTVGMSPIAEQIPLDILHSASVIMRGRTQSDENGGSPSALSVTELDEGGYNKVFLISPRSNTTKPVVLRLPMSNSLLPYQLMNEVGCLSMISSKGFDIPVPKVYDSSADSPNPFMIQEYIDGKPLSEMWDGYTQEEKLQVAHTIAEIIVKMGEIRFDGIGGFTGSAENLLGPTVEASKTFQGRNKFHSNECYHIGPYKSTKEYVLACYDREIYYYTHAPASDIDSDLFTDISVEQFVQKLRKRRRSLETSYVARDYPFVLLHGDFRDDNIMMRGTKVQAVLDWEFSGAYPLSEIVADVINVINDEKNDEHTNWGARILYMAKDIARKRGWPKKEVALLTGPGDPILEFARGAMFPRIWSEDSTDNE